MKSTLERIWARVDRDPNGCWLWTGPTSEGYGRITIGGSSRAVHRLVYALCIGEIPPGLLIRHACDVRHCVRPDHLDIGTHADNSRDMVERGRSARNSLADRTHCPNGHAFNEGNTYWWNGARQCRTCKDTWQREKRAQRNGSSRQGPLTGAAREALRGTVAERYQAGETLREIATPLGRSSAFVRELLIEADVPLRPRHYRRH